MRYKAGPQELAHTLTQTQARMAQDLLFAKWEEEGRQVGGGAGGRLAVCRDESHDNGWQRTNPTLVCSPQAIAGWMLLAFPLVQMLISYRK